MKIHSDMHYIDSGPYPIYIGFTLSEAAFKSEMKRLSIANPPAFTMADATTHFFTRSGGGRTAIITMPKPVGRTPIEIQALLVHEATHIWQEIKDAMREEKPGAEVEAYSIQWLSLRLWELYSHAKAQLKK